jgi:hypothetical protein
LCARLAGATVAAVGAQSSDTEVAVARQPSGTGSAEESSDAPAEGLDSGAEVVDEGNVVNDEIDDELDGDQADEETDEADEAAGRSDATDSLWADVRMQPVEIALPSGVGYTLRAYRPSTEVRPPDVSDREDDFPTRSTASPFDEELDEREALSDIDEDELTAQALAAGREQADGARDRPENDSKELDDEAEVADDEAEVDATEAAEAETAEAEDAGDVEEAEDEAEDEAGEEPEEVPLFLAERGQLLLFRSPEGLVEYIRSGADHELTQLDTWDDLADRVEADDVVPLDEDRYELDLVVENLRGGHDVWDAPLIIQAGEVARDLGYALRIQAVMTALSPGSPLDDMDEGLRVVEAGGFGSFFARRKLRKIDAQTTAALGWRTIIGKISAVVDWRN